MGFNLSYSYIPEIQNKNYITLEMCAVLNYFHAVDLYLNHYPNYLKNL